MKVVVAGQGYVGLPLAIRAAEVGYHVVGFDVDIQRVKRLAAGDSYVEDVSRDQLLAALDSGRYTPTSTPGDMANFDVAVITVPTPLRNGIPDLSYVEQSAHQIAHYLRPNATVILESTTYPGTTTQLVRPILEEISGWKAGTSFHLGFSPERIDPGNQHWSFRTTPKIVSGVNAGSLKAVRAFYDSLVDTTVPVSTPDVAELAKIIENTFRHVNIALVNELAEFAHLLGIDVHEALDAAATKPFGFMRFNPGPGVGGHCLPIDPAYLSWYVEQQTGRKVRLIDLANDINDHRPDYVVQRLVDGLNARRKPLNGSVVVLLGMAYKRNSSDMRASPSVRVAELLAERGARVYAIDPHVTEANIDMPGIRVNYDISLIREADAVVLLTDHDLFKYEEIADNAAYVLDCRRRMAPSVRVELL
ncbi:nucleotide sugar dehydrogenase [Carbonactinospora thermoautotrophica]|uniref:nucleotide sugar dehydrogenase n=1 Tax=Carbonactinospora thermoautotrophica TaxID=1469144 RepID=UPI00226F23EB|nr:nucleotide sugar dehydrogenase [Carbonactinospora thermoautotrophica]MCX9191611.1 nucleotide sugar dehydrogenase [Carbonactinospora thermoautotrophica]